MNYVVVDFEWNQSCYGKNGENRRMPCEIIEIGAVLLDNHFQEVDRFSRTVRPKVYKKMNHITKNLTGITPEELEVSNFFPDVVLDFIYWCGEDFMFCTWGNTDLLELQRNMKYYGLCDLLEGPIKYYNVQKLFRLLYSHNESASALEKAVEYFHLPKNQAFHRAFGDAFYTAEIFKQMDMSMVEKFYSVDYYQNPICKKDEIHLVYETYYKYVSREFDSREEMMNDKEVRSTKCYKCGRATRKKMHWFVGRKHWYCLSKCPEHGYIQGKIVVKKTDEDRFYAVKTLRLVDSAGADYIHKMKEDVLAKRREKKLRAQEYAQCQ